MFIPIDNAKIFATAFGSPNAPVIVGVGGWIGNWELWADPFAILSERWRTIAYDHRGAGTTLAPIETITVETMTQDVFAVLDAFQVERCVLAAESAGVLIAMLAALAQPQRVQGLVLVDGMYYRPRPSGADLFIQNLQSHYAPTIKQFVDNCVPEPDGSVFREWGYRILNRATQDAAIRLLECLYDVDVRERAQEITQPTLIIHGEADRIVPLASSQWLAQQIRTSQLVTVPEAGHVPTITRPHIVARAIADFFK